jgi:hypothetical protein
MLDIQLNEGKHRSSRMIPGISWSDPCPLVVKMSGIRFFDIRIAERKGILLGTCQVLHLVWKAVLTKLIAVCRAIFRPAYHGPFPQLVPFSDMLQQLYAFLSAHPKETAVFCIQQEAPSSHLFSSLVRTAMQDGIDRGLWFLDNRIPRLGEVRGKGILMSRFGGGADGGLGPWMETVDGQQVARIGWHPGSWPDSLLEGFEWDCGGTPVRTQDW